MPTPINQNQQVFVRFTLLHLCAVHNFEFLEFSFAKFFQNRQALLVLFIYYFHFVIFENIFVKMSQNRKPSTPAARRSSPRLSTKLPQLAPRISPTQQAVTKVTPFKAANKLLVKSPTISKSGNSLTNSVKYKALTSQERPIKRNPRKLDPIKTQQAELADIKITPQTSENKQPAITIPRNDLSSPAKENTQDQPIRSKIPKLSDPFNGERLVPSPPRSFLSMTEGSKIPIRINTRTPLPAIQKSHTTDVQERNVKEKKHSESVEEEKSPNTDTSPALTQTKPHEKIEDFKVEIYEGRKPEQIHSEETKSPNTPVASPAIDKKPNKKIQDFKVEIYEGRKPGQSHSVQETKSSNTPVASPVNDKKPMKKIQDFKVEIYEGVKPFRSNSLEATNKNDAIQETKSSNTPVASPVTSKKPNKKAQDFKVEIYEGKKPVRIYSLGATNDATEESQSVNTHVTTPIISKKSYKKAKDIKVEIYEGSKPPVQNGESSDLSDVRNESTLVKKFNKREENKISLLPSRYSPKKLVPDQESLPGKDPMCLPGKGVDYNQEMDAIVKEFQKLYEDLLQLKKKYTGRGLEEEGKSPKNILKDDTSHVTQLKQLVKGMTRTVAEVDDGLDYERNISRSQMDDFQLNFSKTKEKLNANLVFHDKELQMFKTEAERLTKDNVDLKKSLKEKEIYENIEFEYMEGLVMNSMGKDKAEERCKEALAANDALKKDLTNRVRELKNLRSDIKKRANCPSNILDEYTTLKNERNGMDLQLAQLLADVNEAARRRMNIDAANQKLRNHIEKLNLQIQELGGEVPNIPECEVKAEKFKFGKTVVPLKQDLTDAGNKGNDDKQHDDHTNNVNDSETREEMVNRRNAENEKQKLSSSSSAMVESDALSVKGMTTLLHDIAKQLDGNKVDLSLTVESPKAIRFYFNSDLVNKEVGRLQRQFTMSTIKDATVNGNGVVYKRIGKKKVKATLGKKKIRQLINANGNNRQITCITEESSALNEDKTDEKTATEMECEKDEIVKDHEIIGDIMLLLRGTSL